MLLISRNSVRLLHANEMVFIASLIVLHLVRICIAASISPSHTLLQLPSLLPPNVSATTLSSIFDWPEEGAFVKIRGTASSYLHMNAYGPGQPGADIDSVLNALNNIALGAIPHGPPPSLVPVSYKEGPVTVYVMFMSLFHTKNVVLSVVVGMLLQWTERNGVRDIKHADIGIMDPDHGFDVIAAMRVDIRPRGGTLDFAEENEGNAGERSKKRYLSSSLDSP